MQSRQKPEICGFKTTPKTNTKTKLQSNQSINQINLVISTKTKLQSNQINQSNQSSYKSQVTSYTQGQRNPKSRLSVFCCCLAWNISEPPRNCAEENLL